MGIMTRDEQGWCSTQLKKAMERHNVTPVCFSYHTMVGRVNYAPVASVNEVDILQDLDALITRPIGRGSLEEILFRMDLLHRLERMELLIVNPPLAIERSVDKYNALALFQENGLPVPRTAVTESHDEALKCFHELGEDVVVKPLFGSRGVGATRISDPDVAARVFRAISFYHGVLYLQEFINHGGSDIRAFVVGDRVVAAMRRVSANWKTNVSLGAKPVSVKLSSELEELAVRAAKVIQPGWRGLQSVTAKNIADEIICYIISELKR